MVAANRLVLLTPTERRPDLGVVWKPEARRHHSGHHVVRAVHGNGLPYNLRVRSQVLLPESITQNDDIRASRLVFISGDDGPKNRLHPERLEKCARHRTTVHLLGPIAPGQRKAAIAINRHLVKDMVLLLPVEIIGRRNRKCRYPWTTCLRGNVPYPHQAFRMIEREGLQKNAIHHAEDGSVRPDS